MRRIRSSFSRAAVAALILVGTCGIGAAIAGAPAAIADTAPPSSATPATVSADALPTAQLNGVAWTQLVVGNTVFVGGSFSTAQPAGAAAGVGAVKRSDMLAYTLSTGVLVPGFAPAFNGEVRGLAVSADGSTVYAVGAFTTVNGVARNHIAALKATTGALTSFDPGSNGEVWAIARAGSTLYLGGVFTTVGGATRTRAAAVTTAGALTSWAPAIPDDRVDAIVVNPAATKVVLGGNFSGLNGSTGRPYQGSGMVDASTGRTNLPWAVGQVEYHYGPNTAVTSLSSDGTKVYGTGFVYNAGNQGNLEGTFAASWADGSTQWIEDCHGDSYSSAPFANVLYTAGHAHSCANIGGYTQTQPGISDPHHRAISFTLSATHTITKNTEGTYPSFTGQPCPTLLDWFPLFDIGSYTGQNQGPWSVAASGQYVVYGGEFTTVNGVRQQGLVRFAVAAIAPNKQGPRLSGADLAPTLVASGSSVRVSWTSDWDRDNQQLTYRLYRGTSLVDTIAGPSTFWSRPTLTFTDTGRSGRTSYHLTATDPWGNAVTGSTATVQVTSVAAVAPANRTSTSPSVPPAIPPSAPGRRP